MSSTLQLKERMRQRIQLIQSHTGRRHKKKSSENNSNSTQQQSQPTRLPVNNRERKEIERKSLDEFLTQVGITNESVRVDAKMELEKLLSSGDQSIASIQAVVSRMLLRQNVGAS